MLFQAGQVAEVAGYRENCCRVMQCTQALRLIMGMNLELHAHMVQLCAAVLVYC